MTIAGYILFSFIVLSELCRCHFDKIVIQEVFHSNALCRIHNECIFNQILTKLRKLNTFGYFISAFHNLATQSMLSVCVERKMATDQVEKDYHRGPDVRYKSIILFVVPNLWGDIVRCPYLRLG